MCIMIEASTQTQGITLSENALPRKSRVQVCEIYDQVADIFTKPLKFDDFQSLRSSFGVKKKNQN